MRARAVLALAIIVLLGGCTTEALSRPDVAESIGSAVVERLTGPVETAPVSPPADSLVMLDAELDELLASLVFPEGVSDVIHGNTSWAAMGDWGAYSMAFVVVPEDDESEFCLLVAVASDGQTAISLDPGHPRNLCEESQLIDLAPTG